MAFSTSNRSYHKTAFRGFGRACPYGNRRIPRSRDDRWLAGVCGGLAAAFNLSPTVLRVGIIISLIIWPVFPLVFISYIALALWMAPGTSSSMSASESDYLSDMPRWQDYKTPDEALCELNHQFETIEERIRGLEDLVTSKEFILNKKFENL